MNPCPAERAIHLDLAGEVLEKILLLLAGLFRGTQEVNLRKELS
jgi:hypothetical protein